jgi:hypothetical protein
VNRATARTDAILEANLKALGRRFPDLARLVAQARETALEPLTSASGEPSARAPGGALLHSSRDPRAEARRVAHSASERGADTAVLLGLGLGYLAEACLETEFPRVLACEAGPGALAAAFRLRDLSALVSDERLGFVVGGEPESVITALELSGGTRATLLELKAATAADPAWFERARRGAERWNAKGAVNENTLRRFGRLWVRNLARNLGQASESAGVERLAGLFAGMPALVLAAGPSLDLVLPRIGELSRRALVVCVDTALRSLLRLGLEPDFLVVVDPQYWNWRHLAGLSSPSSFLVSETSAWPAVFRASRRGVFLGGSLFPLGRKIDALAGAKGHLGAGGSVATSAWDLCRIMGCAPVWMAGLDLGYPGGQTHARASLFEQRALASGCRLSPAASGQAAALVGEASFEAASAEGGRLRTDERMALYAWWFESRFARPESPPTVSLGRGGLAVPGLALGSVEELLAGPDRRGEIDEALRRAEAMATAAAGGAGASRRAGMAEGLGALRGQLESIAREAEAALEAARAGRGAFSSGGDCRPWLAALDRADAVLLGIEARDVAGFLLPPLAELIGRGARDVGENLERSETIYRELAQSARYHLEVLASAELPVAADSRS